MSASKKVTRYELRVWVFCPMTDGLADYTPSEVERMAQRALRKLELNSDLEVIDFEVLEELP